MPCCCLSTATSYVKLFGKAQVDVNLSLGQFVKVRNNLLPCSARSSQELNQTRTVLAFSDFSFLLLQSRNIDNEFDFQQLAYFKTRIGVSNSFQVCWGCYSVSSVARCTFSPSLNGMAHCLTKVCSIKGANYLRLTAPVYSQLSCYGQKLSPWPKLPRNVWKILPPPRNYGHFTRSQIKIFIVCLLLRRTT